MGSCVAEPAGVGLAVGVLDWAAVGVADALAGAAAGGEHDAANNAKSIRSRVTR